MSENVPNMLHFGLPFWLKMEPLGSLGTSNYGQISVLGPRVPFMVVLEAFWEPFGSLWEQFGRSLGALLEHFLLILDRLV